MICSESRERSIKYKKLTDSIIMTRRLRLMSLHTSSPSSASELEKLIKPDKGYLVIVDTEYCADWEKTVLRISSECRRIKFCLLSASPDKAAEAINISSDICGYVNTSSGGFDARFETVLVNIYSRMVTACGGIMTFDSDGALKIISFSDIYYIETIKQQHRCTIYHKNGSDIVRADISKLIGKLDGRFEITRSSTIANLSTVRKFRDGLLYFDNDLCCTVTAKKQSEIKKIMRENFILG